jgi:hypothetical protein
VSGAIVIHDASILVGKGSKTENVGDQLSVYIRDEGRSVLTVLVIGDGARHEFVMLIVGDEARHELPMKALGWRRAWEGWLGGPRLLGGRLVQTVGWLFHLTF